MPPSVSHVVRRDVRPADSAGQIRRQFYFTNALGVPVVEFCILDLAMIMPSAFTDD